MRRAVLSTFLFVAILGQGWGRWQVGQDPGNECRLGDDGKCLWKRQREFVCDYRECKSVVKIELEIGMHNPLSFLYAAK